MCNVTDTCKGFASEAVGTDRCEIFKLLQLRGREPLTQDCHVIFLENGHQDERHASLVTIH